MGEQRPDGGGTGGGGDGRFYGWPSSRIVRVSRATGGKDRHSKILTSKGTRDRRVRLSVNTAIQFYDLQDRLGYDQPSKAVEWLLTAAASSIAELPPMNCSFLVNPKQLSSAKMSAGAGGFQLGLDSAEVEIGRGGGDGGRGSGNSKNSKGLGTSISRSDNRIKAGEKAKEKENESSYVASFTELLSGKISSVNGGGHSSNSANSDALIHQDYFTGGLGLPPDHRHHHHQELQPFSFSGHNLVSSPAINRGTLQSNSPLPRFPPEDGGSPPNFFIGGDHRHHFLTGFDARLQLYYGQKEEEKN